MNIQSDGGFKCIKVFLTVSYSLAIAGTALLIGVSVMGLSALGKIETEQQQHQQSQLPGQIKYSVEIEEQRKILSISMAIGTYSMILSIIALVGVIKEYHYVMIVMTVFGGLQWTANLFFMPGLHPISVLGVFFPTITGVYAYSIIQRNKVKQDSTANNSQAFYHANAYSSKDFIKNKV